MKTEKITINNQEFLINTQVRSGVGYVYDDGLYLEAREVLPDGYTTDRFILLDESDVAASFADAIDWIEGDGSAASDIRLVRIMTVE